MQTWGSWSSAQRRKTCYWGVHGVSNNHWHVKWLFSISWWFWNSVCVIWLVVTGTFFVFFPYIGNSHPDCLIYFSEGLKPPTSFVVAFKLSTSCFFSGVYSRVHGYESIESMAKTVEVWLAGWMMDLLHLRTFGWGRFMACCVWQVAICCSGLMI